MLHPLHLNHRAHRLCRTLVTDATLLRIQRVPCESGAALYDLGLDVAGGLEAGRRLAEICLAGLGHVVLHPCPGHPTGGPQVVVQSDHPVAACLASQYAGWKIARGNFFGMGSGPMRAAAAKEALFERIGHTETTDVAVGVLETAATPPAEIVAEIAADCHVRPDALTLLLAPTRSLAGSLQIVARSLETALHKLLELGFDPNRLVSGWGAAPLPPQAHDDLAAIGRTNDAILYGGEVMLWVRGDDESLAEIGPRVPSSASPAFGQPFRVLFAEAGGDFYKLDPHLFSPARVTFCNVETGHSFSFGATAPQVLKESFGT